MSRQNIFVILKDKYNAIEEANKIKHIFEQKLIEYIDFSYNKEFYTPEEFFDEYLLFDVKKLRRN